MRRLLVLVLSLSLVIVCFSGCSSIAENMPTPPSTVSLPQLHPEDSTKSNHAEMTIPLSPTQVPESVVALTANVNLDAIDRYTIVHDYDSEAHIDHVELSLFNEEHYGMDVSSYNLWYQYDKASDIWTLIKKDDPVYREEINVDAYMDNSPWVGRDNYIGCEYSVFFYDIDVAQSVVEVAYTITFDGNDTPTYTNSGTYDLNYGYSINLPYKTAYDSDYLTLVFDQNVGLREWGIWGLGTAN